MTAGGDKDRQLAAAALEKRLKKETPSRAEEAALRRVAAAREEEQRREHYATIPQKHWREMSGRQAKILQEQAERYGIPFGGAVVNLPAVVRALHDFLAENGRYLTAGDVDSKERKTRLEADRLQIKLDRERGEVAPIDDIHNGLASIATILRSAIMTLQKQFGAEAFKIMDDALGEAERIIAAALPPMPPAPPPDAAEGDPDDAAAAATQ